MLDLGRPIPPGRLAAVFTSSETLLAFQRESIEEAFGAPAYDRYGASEFSVSMTAGPDRRLYVDMEFCIVEIEPEEETDDFIRGPLLVTGLSNEAMPLLRYRIGDTGTLLKRPSDPCRAGMVFESIDGRIEDYAITPDGRAIGRLDHVFKDQTGVAEAQIRQQKPEEILVMVVPTDAWNSACRDKLVRSLRIRLGREIRILIQEVQQIERQGEKFRFVESEVGRLRSTRVHQAGSRERMPQPDGPK
jgi:phenylacetate-CoA ligase